MESRLVRLEAVQSMLLEIGLLSTSCSDITTFIRAVHQALGRIMYAANFYVALSDREQGTVRFVYFVDEQDAGSLLGDGGEGFVDAMNELGLAEASLSIEKAELAPDGGNEIIDE